MNSCSPQLSLPPPWNHTCICYHNKFPKCGLQCPLHLSHASARTHLLTAILAERQRRTEVIFDLSLVFTDWWYFHSYKQIIFLLWYILRKFVLKLTHKNTLSHTDQCCVTEGWHLFLYLFHSKKAWKRKKKASSRCSLTACVHCCVVQTVSGFPFFIYARKQK